MKKLTLSIAAIAAMGTFAVAGGDIAPVEPVVETPVVVENTDAGFYVGAAYGLASWNYSISAAGTTFTDLDENFNEFMILGGYKVNPYVAIEGRYWFGSSDDITWGNLGTHNTSIDAWGVYVKPMYPVTDVFDVYALLGYGSVDMTVKDPGSDYVSSADGSDDGFSWGLGASYEVTPNVGIFVDWIRNYDDTITYNVLGTDVDEESTVDTFNFGVTYKF
jgi:opacity protein-like surface antigen